MGLGWGHTAPPPHVNFSEKLRHETVPSIQFIGNEARMSVKMTSIKNAGTKKLWQKNTKRERNIGFQIKKKV